MSLVLVTLVSLVRVCPFRENAGGFYIVDARLIGSKTKNPDNAGA